MRGPGTAGLREVARSSFTISYAPRDPPAAVFKCEACGHEVRDLRAVYLSHRRGGWRIECSRHDDADYVVDAGRVFGGGLNALEFFAELAAARWFEPADLFKTFLRLRAQASGLYLAGGRGEPD
jgi:hypothetical protein